MTAAVLVCVGAGSIGTPLAQSKTSQGGTAALPFEPWARVFSPQERPHPDTVRPVPPARRGDRMSPDTRPPCVMPILEVDADLDRRMVVLVPDTNVEFAMPTIEASCAPVRR